MRALRIVACLASAQVSGLLWGCAASSTSPGFSDAGESPEGGDGGSGVGSGAFGSDGSGGSQGSSGSSGGSSSGGFGGSGNGGPSGSSSGGGGSGGAGASGGSSGGSSGTCAATVSAGALILASNYLASSVIADGGYAYSFDDGMGSTACLDTDALCGSGTTAVATPTGTVWGSGLGFSLNQAMATGQTSPPVNPFAVPAADTGITYSLSALPTQGARLIIDDNGMDYCAPLSAASGTVSWAKFNTKCWDGSGTSLSGAPQVATHVQFQVTAGSASAPFDFCVTAVSFSH